MLLLGTAYHQLKPRQGSDYSPKESRYTSFLACVPLPEARLITPNCDELQKPCLVHNLTKVQKDGVTLWHSASLLQQNLGKSDCL